MGVPELSHHGRGQQLLELWGTPAMKPEWFERDIIVPANDAEKAAVRVAQRALRVSPTGEMDTATKTALRGAQYLFGLPVTGTLDEATAVVIDGLRPYSLQEDE